MSGRERVYITAEIEQLARINFGTTVGGNLGVIKKTEVPSQNRKGNSLEYSQAGRHITVEGKTY